MYIPSGMNEAAVREYISNFGKFQFALRSINEQSGLKVECSGIPANKIIDMDSFMRNVQSYFDRPASDSFRLMGENFRIGERDEWKSWGGITISYEHFIGRNIDAKALDEQLRRTVLTERYQEQAHARAERDEEAFRHRGTASR